ncbi:MAG TPA: AbrB/MazE/SpoVT family DNA-binding domain-containing protein [Candidatus Methanomethylia archaeon]|nr:AbrB/MazE/SpoVT family DNA-binding domain-containing protein [Candidatus Methanomethylicia archaeon]
MKTILKICRKGAIYLSKKILESLGAQEGDHLSVKVENGKLILEVIPDPLLLAARTKKWAWTTVEEFEKGIRA